MGRCRRLPLAFGLIVDRRPVAVRHVEECRPIAFRRPEYDITSALSGDSIVIAPAFRHL
jgi:hypothetical protein